MTIVSIIVLAMKLIVASIISARLFSIFFKTDNKEGDLKMGFFVVVIILSMLIAILVIELHVNPERFGYIKI